MRRELKPGDRVAVYVSERVVGTVIGPSQSNPGALVVRPDREDMRLPSVHPKQCRRLVKRERQEWSGRWRKLYLAGDARIMAFVPDEPNISIIGTEMTLREVRTKKGESK